MNTQQQIAKSLKKRHIKEVAFKNTGLFAVILSLTFLVILFYAIISKGYSSFISHKIVLEVELKTEYFAEDFNYSSLLKKLLIKEFPEVEDSFDDKIKLYSLLSKISRKEIRDFLNQNKDKIGQTHQVLLTVSSRADIFLKNFINQDQYKTEDTNLTEKQIGWIKSLHEKDKFKTSFNINFFQRADSTESEIAGVGAGVVGSLFTVIIFLACAFPIGVMAGFYLEEFAPKNIFTDVIEVAINNLAAIPSIIYGLLGLIVYLNFMHLPRSSALVGGMTLALLVLPIIIIATRSAIKIIPPYIKDAAIALGASKVQVIFHHTLPLSLPGIMTGTILAVSRALGETAPLLMIGMVAFVADIPESFTDPTSVLPVQIYLWSDSPEQGFAQNTAGAIMVLLAFLLIFNGIAVYLRKKFEKKW